MKAIRVTLDLVLVMLWATWYVSLLKAGNRNNPWSARV